MTSALRVILEDFVNHVICLILKTVLNKVDLTHSLLNLDAGSVRISNIML
jgi:hypothetical protein